MKQVSTNTGNEEMYQMVKDNKNYSNNSLVFGHLRAKVEYMRGMGHKKNTKDKYCIDVMKICRVVELILLQSFSVLAR